MSELQHIISKGEGAKLEFEPEISNIKHLAATLVAFANSKGGSVLIGVKYSGKIKGVNPYEEGHMIEEVVSIYTKPSIPYNKVIWKDRHHMVVEIKVNQSKLKYQAKDDNNEWRPFIRIGGHTCPTNKIIDLAWKLSDTFNENAKYNGDCKNEIALKLEGVSLTLSKLYADSNFTLREVDYNLSCLLYMGMVDLSFSETKILYTLLK
ncbi:MAG: ATP-binding protein [Crocinitomicaceae bacterium]|jgi:predicted HTH transcriptional regulator